VNIINTFEWITLINLNTGLPETIIAKVDTGAYSSSIDVNEAFRLGLPITDKEVNVVSALGSDSRKTVFSEVTLSTTPCTIPVVFSMADRRHLKYQILLGRKDLVDFYVHVLEYKPKE
jgi:hypothetical protein